MPKGVYKRKRNLLEEGTRYGRLVLLKNHPPTKENRYYMTLCECDCGVQKMIRASSLKDGYTRSCGCLLRESQMENSKTHGLSKNPVYRRWVGMHSRCYNPNGKDYKHYGGRGIAVCDEWHGDEGLLQFMRDMEPSFVRGLEIDRIDVNEDYTKDNCRWTTRRQQVINRRPMGVTFDAHFLEYEGETMCISEWAERVRIPSTMLGDRVTKLGWTVERALTQPPKVRVSRLSIGGKDFTTKEIFKSPPNIHPIANALGLRSYEYQYALFGEMGEFKIYLSKEWVEVKLPEGFDRDVVKTRTIPLFTEEFSAHLKDIGAVLWWQE